MRPEVAWSLAVFSAVCAGGCSSADRAPVAEVVDSAGVRLLTYELSRVEVPPHRLVGAYDLEIGVVDGDPEYAFSQIVDLALPDDGSIVVSDGAALELRVFSPSGQFVRAIGQAGEGPGEFAVAPTMAGLSGDTVIVFDRRSNRLTSFTLDGDLVGLVTLRSDVAGLPETIIRLEDGTFLASSRWTDPSAEVTFFDMRLELDSAVVARLDTGGTPLDTLRVMPDRTRARIVQDAGSGQVRTIQANSPYSARAVVASSGGGAVVGHSGVFELELFGRDWSTEAILRVRGVDHPATANEIRARQEAAIREEIGDQELDPNVRRLNIEFLPERLPAFANLVVGEQGDVWVALTEYDLSGGTDWLAFDRTGVLLGSVHTPPEFRLRAIRADYIVGFVLDEFDVPYVRRYPLTAGTEGQD